MSQHSSPTASASRFSALIEAHKARTGVSDTELARRVGVSRQNLFNWRTTDLRGLPGREHLEQLARVVELPYEVVLDAALADAGYLPPKAGVFIDCLDPLVRSSAAEFARESAWLYDRAGSGVLIVGTGTVRVLARLWQTMPTRAVSFLWDYLTVLHGAEPTITWEQVTDGLRREFGPMLTMSEREEFLATVHEQLSFLIEELPPSAQR